MIDNKPWYASSTIWGGIMAIGSGLGGAYYGYTQKDPLMISAGLTSAYGGLQAIIGRFKATTPIGKPAVVIAK